jgi:hypothetical protein
MFSKQQPVQVGLAGLGYDFYVSSISVPIHSTELAQRGAHQVTVMSGKGAESLEAMRAWDGTLTNTTEIIKTEWF